MNSLYKNDPVWTKKIEELANACVSLDSFLEDLRAHHANGLPKDAEADCLELAKSLATVHMQALTHDKGGESMIKTPGSVSMAAENILLSSPGSRSLDPPLRQAGETDVVLIACRLR